LAIYELEMKIPVEVLKYIAGQTGNSIQGIEFSLTFSRVKMRLDNKKQWDRSAKRWKQDVCQFADAFDSGSNNQCGIFEGACVLEFVEAERLPGMRR